MNRNKENFKLWYRDIIESLYDNESAGFAILMLTFPLLERYLRSKSKLSDKDSLNDIFYNALVKLFPALKDNKTASLFWNVYRNGILHQVTLSQQDRKGNMMPDGGVSGDIKESIKFTSNHFYVNPAEFAKKVIYTIDEDFLTFEALGVSGNPPLPSVQTSTDGYYETCGSAQRNVTIGYSGWFDKAKS
ncbi:MAG: hypothetical protein AB2L12_07180 [Smithellaceae bacterium]